MAAQTNSWASGNAGAGSQETANNLLTAVANYVWNTSSLTWVTETQPGGGGGGGGTQYVQGTVNASPTGTVAMGLNAASGTLTSLATDASGNLLVNVAVGGGGGGGGSNAAAGQTGLAVPLYAGYTGYNVAGNLVGVSATNALPVQPGTGAVFPSSQSGAWATRMQDGAGNAISSLSDGGGGLLGIAVSLNATNFVASTNNSTTTQLGSGATFTGVIETIYAQQSISIDMTSDQPGTLTLNQYIDLAGTRKIAAWTFAISAGVPFSMSRPGNGNYFNLTFQNTGGAATTTLNISTAYGTIPSATALGNQPSSINEINGTAFSLGQATMAGSLPVVLASNQSAVSVSGSVSVSNFPATQPISGTVAVSNFPATQPVSGTVNVGTRGWTLASGTDSVAAVQSGTWNIGSITTLPSITGSVSVSNFPATQTVAGTVNVGTRGWTLNSATDSVTVVGGGAGTQYAQGTTVATPTGTVALGQNPSNVVNALKTDASGNLNVNLAAGSISGGNAAASPTGAAVPASADYQGWNNGGTLTGTSLTAPLPIAPSATNFFQSTANSSTAQLAAGGNFTGSVWDSTLSQQALSLLITSDQPVSISIMQAIDSAGTYQLPAINFTATAGVGVLRSFILNGNYLKLSVTNTGTATTTLLNINTYYGTIAPSNNSGNEAVSLYDASGNALTSQSYPGIGPNGATGYALEVDPTYAAADGIAYNTLNVPQVDVIAGRGTDANVHSILTDMMGRVQTQESNPQIVEVLRAILIEMRVTNSLLMDGLLPGKLSESVDNRRIDEDIYLNLNG